MEYVPLGFLVVLMLVQSYCMYKLLQVYCSDMGVGSKTFYYLMSLIPIIGGWIVLVGYSDHDYMKRNNLY